MNTTEPNQRRTIHEGRNVKRFREMLGIKQDALAIELGNEWSQKKVSLMEARETIDQETLTAVAKALKVPEEAIRNFDEKMAINNIHNNYAPANEKREDSSAHLMYNHCIFSIIDKLVEEIRTLYSENKNLYERLLKMKKEEI